ncbi:Non-specific serine/threonine protein kinase protein, partial [Dioscorea alata]
VINAVKALGAIAGVMGKNDWNFTVDPCTGKGNWIVPSALEDIDSSVTCHCHRDNTCSIVSIRSLKGQNLTGVLPSELRLLQNLQNLDLSRNGLTGEIPEQWISLSLKEL